MPRKYGSPIIPHQVIMRMHPEHVALCYHLRIGADDVQITPQGEAPQPNALYLREPDKKRKNQIWYFREVVGDCEKRHSTGCKANDRDGAIAWVLRHIARKADAARCRVAPEDEPACAIFAEYGKVVKAKLRRGEIKPHTGLSYLGSLKMLGTCFRKASVADLQAGGASKFRDYCEALGYSANTAVNGNNVCKRAVNTVMKDRGSAYRLDFHVGMRQHSGKRPCTPDELDRIMDRVLNLTIYGPDLKPLTVEDPKTGLMVPKRCDPRTARFTLPFRTAVPFLLETGTRKQAACEVTFTDPTGAFLDLDAGILHRRGMMTQDTPAKRRGSCVLSSAYMAEIRPIAEAAISRGIVHLIHDASGKPLKSLSVAAWKKILADAQVPYRCIHCLKDTAVQIARVEGVPLYSAAERFATAPETLVAHYGADWDLGLQIDPAEAQGTRAKWRAMHAAAKARTERADEARAAREAVAAILVPKFPRRSKGPKGGRPSGDDTDPTLH